MTRLFPHLPIAIAMALAAATSTRGAAADDSVALRFAWPDDLTGRATYTQHHESEQDAGTATVLEAHGSNRFSVSPVDDDLVVVFDDTSFDVVLDTSTGLSRQIAEVFAQINRRPPDFRVNRAGRFVGLERSDDFLQTVRAAVEPITAAIGPDDLESLAPTIKRALSRGEFARTSANQWRDLVGRWAGMEIETNRAIVEQETMHVPFTGGGQIPVRATYRFLGHVPCGESGGAVCVELELRTVAEGPAALLAYVSILRRNDSQTVVNRYRFESTTRVISDPDTLIPYRRHTDWMSSLELDGYEDPISIRQSGTLSITYEYD